MLARKNRNVFILATFLALLLVPLPIMSYGQTSDSASKVLIFLRDVGMVDVTKYDVADTIGPLVDYELFGGIPYTSGKLTLNSETSVIDVLYNFIGDSLASCTIEPVYGSAKYLQPLTSNLADAVTLFLQKYQTYAGFSSIAEIQDTLVGIDTTKDTVRTVGNIRFEISHTDLGTSFKWEKTYNGAVYPGFGVIFKNGAIYSFGQNVSYQTIGNTDVNITREQAIEIALKRAESYSYTYQDQKIDSFNILKDKIIGELEVRSRYKPFELYPIWKVDLPLDDIYPGSVFFIRTNIWADTGEILNIRPLGGGGYDIPTVSESDSGSGNSAAPVPVTSIFVIAVVISTIVALGIVALKKRSE